MKALSLRQPWAWLVARGLKKMETRRWGTNYRGRILIHASGKWDRAAQRVINNLVNQNAVSPFKLAAAEVSEYGFKYTGGIIGFADLVVVDDLSTPLQREFTEDLHLCVPLDRYKWSKKSRGWLMLHARQFKEPIPCKGALSLWTPPEDVMEKVNEQLK